MNLRNLLKSVLILLFAAILPFAFPARNLHASSSPPYNVIIISWDGVQRNHLNELLQDGELPNLAALAGEGTMIPMEITDHQTQTKPGHAQMLTGYAPQITGVYGNPEGRYGPIPEGLSVFERLESFFGPDNIVTIALTGKSHHIGSLPARRCRQKTKEKDELIDCAAEPWNLTKRYIDVWDGDIQRDAETVGPRALEYLENFSDKPFFFFLHFSDPDEEGHKYGENSDEYSRAIVACDKWLGFLRKRLAKLGIAGRTLVFVTTDHGFDEGQKQHLNAPDIWLATNFKGLKAKTSDQKDLAPTLLKLEGVDIDSLSPALPGKPLF